MEKMLERAGSSAAHRITAPCFLALFAVLTITGCTGVAQQTPQAGSPQISVVPSSIAFSNVVVGQNSSQTVQISNSGNKTLNVTGISLTGASFSLSSVSVPFQLAPGATKTFTITFTPTSTASSSATLTITSDAPSSPLTVAIQGSGAAASASWQMTPASLAFSTIALQTTQTLTGTINNTGNVSLTIGSVSLSNPEWSTTGLSSGTVLTSGQQLTFNVNFHPTVAGNATGTLQVAAASGASALTMNLAGAGANSVQHTVTLTWDPSTGVVSGYRIYRGTISGGPYSLLNSTLDANTSYLDSSVVSGTQYFYVSTAVDSTGAESVFSNEASATIPNP